MGWSDAAEGESTSLQRSFFNAQVLSLCVYVSVCDHEVQIINRKNDESVYLWISNKHGIQGKLKRRCKVSTC